MDALSQVRTCDPWAVHSAKSFEKHSDGSGTPTPTPIQSEILRVLKERAGVEPSVLLRELGGKLTLKELEREFSTLRHMEKARAEKRDEFREAVEGELSGHPDAPALCRHGDLQHDFLPAYSGLNGPVFRSTTTNDLSRG